MYQANNPQNNNNNELVREIIVDGTRYREVIIDGTHYCETVLIENHPVLQLSSTNNFGIIQTQSILDDMPEGFENLTLEEIVRGEMLAHQMVIDSVGRNPIANILQESATEIASLTENRQIVAAQISNSYERTASTTQNILNQNGVWDYLFKFLMIIQEMPIYQKLFLAGGSLIFIAGGIYIGIKLIRRNSVITNVTPFGLRPDNTLTLFGIMIKRAGNYINQLSIQKPKHYE